RAGTAAELFASSGGSTAGLSPSPAKAELLLFEALRLVAKLGGAFEVEPFRGVAHQAAKARDLGLRVALVVLRAVFSDFGNRVVIELGHAHERIVDRAHRAARHDAVLLVVRL